MNGADLFSGSLCSGHISEIEAKYVVKRVVKPFLDSLISLNYLHDVIMKYYVMMIPECLLRLWNDVSHQLQQMGVLIAKTLLAPLLISFIVITNQL